ncbi:MAG: hypothetical protein K6E75_03765 [Lachnospiraceae bacterium]|nr:hypothetical protein [Lachnospiraceae bacterium]
MVESEKREYYEGYGIGKRSRWLKRLFCDELEFSERGYGTIDKAYIRFGELLDLGQSFAAEEEMLSLQAELQHLIRIYNKREVRFAGGLLVMPEKIGFHDIWDDVCYRRYNLGQKWAGAGIHGAWMLYAERLRMEHIQGFRLPPADPYDSFTIRSLLEYEAGLRPRDFRRNPFFYFISLAETISDLERIGGYRIKSGEDSGLCVTAEEKSANIEEIFRGYGLQITPISPGSVFLEMKDRPESLQKRWKKPVKRYLAAESSGYV